MSKGNEDNTFYSRLTLGVVKSLGKSDSVIVF